MTKGRQRKERKQTIISKVIKGIQFFYCGFRTSAGNLATSFWEYPAGGYPYQPAGTLIRRIRLKVLFGQL